MPKNCNCGASAHPVERNIVEANTDADARAGIIQFRQGVTLNDQVFQPSERISMNYGSIRAILDAYPMSMYFVNQFDRQVFVSVYPQYTGYSI